jgi:hypothetical protein
MLLGILAHEGGIDEMVIILQPVILALGFWFVFRGGDSPRRRRHAREKEPPEKGR